MSDNVKPSAVWLFHPGSGQVQQVSTAAWEAAELGRQTDPEIEGGLHGWFRATADQAVMGEAIKAERLAAQAEPPEPVEPAATVTPKRR